MTQDPPTYVLPAHGNDVHYVRAGSGPPVVLLHGVLGSHRGGGAPPPSGCLCGSHTAPSPPPALAESGRKPLWKVLYAERAGARRTLLSGFRAGGSRTGSVNVAGMR